MLNERTASIASAYWAAHLGCAPEELFAEPFRVVTHGAELADYGDIFALFRGGAVIVSIPPDRADTLRPLLAALPRDCSPESFAAAFTSVSTAVIGPAFIGYAEFPALPAGPARTLGPKDAAALAALQQSCDATEWEHGGCASGDVCSGVFEGGVLAAVAGYEVWGGSIAHICVIAHPDFRGRCFARAAVAHVAGRAMVAGLLPQYRTLESNRASMRIGESLGFEPYARSVAIRLSSNVKPS